MDAAMVTAIAALIGGPVTAAAAIYGTRGATRSSREGGVITGYDSLTAKLVAERDKAETDEAKAHADARAAEAQVHALEAENARLRTMVMQLGGSP
jgi:hypothetical protein